MLKKMLPVFIFALCMLCSIPFSQFACALTTPHIIIDGEIWLLHSENGNRMFLLPNTYYAKIDNLDDNFYYVTFNGVSGKVEKNSVSTVGYHTQAAGTMQEINIHPQYSDFVSIALKSSMDSSSEDIVIPVDKSFIFLGEYPLSEMWYCVRYNENIGYIKASRTTIPEMEIPPFVPETLDGDDPPQITQPPKDKNFFKDPSFLRIIIIIGLSIPAVVLIFLLFKPQKPKRHRYYYEE